MRTVATPTPASIRTALHRFGLERDRLRTMLCRTAGITLSELDALTSGGVTVLVDRLERAGRVRRAVLLTLDDRALAAMPTALVEYHAAVTAAARAIPSASRAAVETFLGSVAARAAATADARAEQR